MSVGKMNPLRDIVNSEKAIIGGGLPDIADQNFTKLIWGKKANLLNYTSQLESDSQYYNFFTEWAQKARVLVAMKHIQPSVM
jgi:hypothetical protein